VLRALYLVRDKRAREMDRPPFKVLGNRTLIDRDGGPRIQSCRDWRSLSLAAAVGRAVPTRCATAADEHGPLPKPRRAGAAHHTPIGVCSRARALNARSSSLDPGVLCPNSALEAIAWRAPNSASDLGQAELMAGSSASSARGRGDRAEAPAQSAALAKRHAPPAELPAGGAF
jgi:hypothetical protein